MPFSKSILVLAAAIASLGGAQAKLDVSSSSNLAVYWGQNSFRGTGLLAQQRLAYYCTDPKLDVFQLAFLMRINSIGGVPEFDFSSANDNCTTFKGTNLLNCPQIATDIDSCQKLGKTIILSIGGATYSEGGFQSEDDAIAGAELVWQTFGPPPSKSSALRPFGKASVDGFDFDFEATVSHTVPFVNRLRELMDTDHSKQYFMTAAPQCPYPDAADKDILTRSSIDAVYVQFYNNWCGLNSFQPGQGQQNAFNIGDWDNWAKNVSQNKNSRVFLGVPGNTGAAGSGYVPAKNLQPIIEFSKTFDSFGGVMIWDVTQAYGNSGFLDGIVTALGKGSARIRRWMQRWTA